MKDLEKVMTRNGKSSSSYEPFGESARNIQS